jgi:hypothetical protein
VAAVQEKWIVRATITVTVGEIKIVMNSLFIAAILCFDVSPLSS